MAGVAGRMHRLRTLPPTAVIVPLVLTFAITASSYKQCSHSSHQAPQHASGDAVTLCVMLMAGPCFPQKQNKVRGVMQLMFSVAFTHAVALFL